MRLYIQISSVTDDARKRHIPPDEVSLLQNTLSLPWPNKWLLATNHANDLSRQRGISKFTQKCHCEPCFSPSIVITGYYWTSEPSEGNPVLLSWLHSVYRHFLRMGGGDKPLQIHRCDSVALSANTVRLGTATATF